MLSRLQVSNYVLIDSLDIEFPEGLVIITGQTGAGKSILLGSISLALGGKADVSVIGENGDKCVVEAEFDVPEDADLKAIVENLDADWDEGHLILRRIVSRTGRARAFVNDTPVTASSLLSLSGRLIDIHSQHQTLKLSDGKFRMALLDHYAGNDGLLGQCDSAYSEYSSCLSRVASLRERIRKNEAERDYNEARFKQLDSASLREGELEELETQQKQLANAEDIKSSLYSVLCAFAGDEQSGMSSIDSVLRDAQRRIEHVSGFIPSLSSLAERLSGARVELDDILSEISETDERLSVSPEKLAEIDERLSLLYSLMQKFGCRSVEELISVRNDLSASLSDSETLEEELAEQDRRLGELSSHFEKCCASLHASREAAIAGFSSSIREALHDIELQNAVFDVVLNPANPGPSGSDSVSFRFSSTGRNPLDVEKCASGGELSRIMLCLKEMMARYTNMPSMIFDEIDTGVSGSVADKMGSKICAMGRYMQVFAITHLPQVAAKGRAHYIVSKETSPEGRAITNIKKLSGDQRVLELARMLSGSRVTDAAVANAKSLLEE